MDVRSRGGGRKIGEGRMLGNRSIKHYRTLPSPFFPIPVYHGSTYKLACVLIKVSAGRQLACQIRTHVHACEVDWLTFKYCQMHPDQTFPFSLSPVMEKKHTHYAQGLRRERSLRAVI